MVLALEILQVILRGVFALTFVQLGPGLRQLVQAGMTTEDPRILIEHVAQQNRQACNQGNGQPETGQDSPEQ